MDKARKLLKKYWLALAILASLALLFWTYLGRGTFYVDDWSFINTAVSANHHPLRAIQTSFSAFGFRPVTAIVLPLAAAVLRANFALVAIFSGLIYLSGILIASQTFYRATAKNKKVSLLEHPGILVLFCLPVISTTFVFGPLTHIATTLSVLLWSISFYSIVRAAEEKNKYWYGLSALFIVLGLLCYEIFAPLLVFNIAVYLYIIHRQDSHSRKSLLEHLGLVLGVILLALILGLFYQKKIAVSVFGETDNSRYHFLGFDYLIRRYLLDWYKLWYVIRYDLVDVAKQSAHLAIHNNWIIFNSLLLTALSILSSYRLAILLRAKKLLSTRELLWWLATGLLSVAAAILMISLSLYPISLEGYLNRVLFPIWFIFAFIWLFLAQYVRPRYLLAALAVVIFASSIVFQAELKMFVRGSEVRAAINQDLGHKLTNLDHDDYTLLAYVPRCAPGTLLNDDIFSQQWDIGSIAEYQSRFRVNKASSIQAWNFTTSGMLRMTQHELIIFGWFTVTSKDMPLLFYSYNQNTRDSVLVRIPDFGHLQLLIDELRTKARDNCKSMSDYGSRVDYIDSRLRKIFSAGPAM